MFTIFAHKGFQVTFENNWKVSVMCGFGNYCQNRYNKEIEPRDWVESFETKTVNIWEHLSSQDAEIAVFSPEGRFSSSFPGCPDYDQVVAYNSPQQMLEIMNWAASQ